MKQKMKSVISLLLLLGTVSISQAAGEVFTTSVSSGVLDAVESSGQVVVFNGQRYNYQVNQKQSVLALDESGMQPLNFRELQVGQKYYFEKISFVEDPKRSQYNKIIFISDTQPAVTE